MIDKKNQDTINIFGKTKSVSQPKQKGGALVNTNSDSSQKNMRVAGASSRKETEVNYETYGGLL